MCCAIASSLPLPASWFSRIRSSEAVRSPDPSFILVLCSPLKEAFIVNKGLVRTYMGLCLLLHVHGVKWMPHSSQALLFFIRVSQLRWMAASPWLGVYMYVKIQA